MRGHASRPIRHAVVATVAALALAAGLLLEADRLEDRLAAGRGHGELPALAAVARERPSAGAFDALARAEAAAGRAGDAAVSAATAARLAPTDVRRAAVAERALDVAARARLRDLSRPVSLAAVATLLLLAGHRLRRARISYAHRRALSGSRARQRGPSTCASITSAPAAPARRGAEPRDGRAHGAPLAPARLVRRRGALPRRGRVPRAGRGAPRRVAGPPARGRRDPRAGPRRGRRGPAHGLARGLILGRRRAALKSLSP